MRRLCSKNYRLIGICLVVLVLTLFGLPAPGYAVDASDPITTVAGDGTFGDGGDGGPATAAQLALPGGVAVDAAGTLYIADTFNNRIRKVDSAGTITTVAGTGTFGYSGDGGPATAAQLFSPNGVVVDATGNLYIADTNNNSIRKVDSAGTITTVAGDGTAGIGGYSGDGGPAAAAQLNLASGVAVDGAGNLYIADFLNHRVRKVDSAGIITTVAGDGTTGYSGDGGPATAAQLSGPFGVAVDVAGNLYIADTFNNRIRKVDSAGTINTVAGTGTAGYSGDGGPAGSAQLALPESVAVDAAGNLYIADSHNSRVRRVAANQAPVASNDSYTTNEDTLLNVAAPGVLGNDSDAEGNALTAVLVSGPSHGALTLHANGSFTYLPSLNFSGSDSFTYHANDGAADSNLATVSLTVVSAATQLSQLIAQVQGLVDNGTLSAGNGNALLVKLQQAQSLLNKGKTADAISILQNDFIPQVQSYISDGVLTATEGQLLIDGANAIIVSLGGTVSSAAAAAGAQTSRLFLPVVTR